MPAKSQRQFRAMQAAAHGHSTLGIPAKVGKEFAEATNDPKRLPEKAKAGTTNVGKTNLGLALYRAQMTKRKPKH